jgi:hypothetical protein
MTRIDAMVTANVPARLRFNMVGPPLSERIDPTDISVQSL